jgi:hypothetical protein
MGKLAARWSAIYFAGYNLTGYSREFDTAVEFDELDTTSYQDGSKNSIPGMGKGTGAITVFLDPIAEKSLEVLKARVGSFTPHSLIILFGNNTTPTEGDVGQMLWCKQYKLQVPGSVVNPFIGNVSFAGDKLLYGGICHANRVGATKITDTWTGASQDGVAQSTKGMVAQIQILTPTTTDSYVVKVQDSNDEVTWVDSIIFTADGQTRTSERGAATGTIEQYTRVIATRTGAADDDFEFAVVATRL